MYAIPFVLSVLVLLSVLSYSNLRTFLNFHITRNEYHHYMRDNEQGNYNANIERLFDNKKHTKQTSSKPGSPDKEPRLSGILNIYTWMNPHAHGEQKDQYSIILERLLNILYKDQPSFAKFYEAQPDLNAQIVERLKDKGKPPQHSLASTDLNNPLIQEAFAMMVNGNITADTWYKKAAKQENLYGYFRSLSDFINCSPTSERPLSIYLAKKELLLALYQDPAIVGKILQERSEYHRHDDGSDEDREQCLTEFVPPGFSDTLFTFTVSGTKPPDYISPNRQK